MTIGSVYMILYSSDHYPGLYQILGRNLECGFTKTGNFATPSRDSGQTVNVDVSIYNAGKVSVPINVLSGGSYLIASSSPTSVVVIPTGSTSRRGAAERNSPKVAAIVLGVFSGLLLLAVLVCFCTLVFGGPRFLPKMSHTATTRCLQIFLFAACASLIFTILVGEFTYGWAWNQDKGIKARLGLVKGRMSYLGNIETGMLLKDPLSRYALYGGFALSLLIAQSVALIGYAVLAVLILSGYQKWKRLVIVIGSLCALHVLGLILYGVGLNFIESDHLVPSFALPLSLICLALAMGAALLATNAAKSTTFASARVV